MINPIKSQSKQKDTLQSYNLDLGIDHFSRISTQYITSSKASRLLRLGIYARLNHAIQKAVNLIQRNTPPPSLFISKVLYDALVYSRIMMLREIDEFIDWQKSLSKLETKISLFKNTINSNTDNHSQNKSINFDILRNFAFCREFCYKEEEYILLNIENILLYVNQIRKIELSLLLSSVSLSLKSSPYSSCSSSLSSSSSLSKFKFNCKSKSLSDSRVCSDKNVKM